MQGTRVYGDVHGQTARCYRGAVVGTRYASTEVMLVGASDPFRNDRISEHVIRTGGLRPDTQVTIRYRDAAPGTFSFFQAGALVRSLRRLVLRSRPLTPISGYRPDYRTGLTITFCSRCLGGEKIYRAI